MCINCINVINKQLHCSTRPWKITAAQKGLKSVNFILDIRQHTDGGQDPTVTLPMQHNVVLQFSGCLVTVNMTVQVLTLQSQLMVRSSPFDASTAGPATTGTSDNWWQRGGINEVRTGYGNCTIESISWAIRHDSEAYIRRSKRTKLESTNELVHWKKHFSYIARLTSCWLGTKKIQHISRSFVVVRY